MNQNKSLDPLFYPKSIAIIGASSDLSKVSSRPLRFLLQHKYEGEIYPVNPKADTVLGLKAYEKLKKIPVEIDLAVIVIPAKYVLAALKECVEAKVKIACVITSGFAEIGAKGKDLQDQIKELVEYGNIRVIGPNCVGVHNLATRSMASISQFCEIERLIVSPIAFISQSGAYGTAIAAMAHQKNIGLQYFISTGNEADLEFTDYVEYAVDDPKINAIAGYVEGIKNGRRFIDIAEKALKQGKPIVLTKVGRTISGSKAASSHTGSLTGSDIVFGAVCEQKGITRCYDVEELLDFTNAFAFADKKSGKNIAIISTSGGAGVLMVDKCEELGLNIPTISEKTKNILENILPDFANLKNPIDVTGQFLSIPHAISRCIEALACDDKIDTIVIFLSLMWSKWEEVCEDLINAINTINKLCVVCWAAAPDSAIKMLASKRIITFTEPIRCIKSVHALSDYEFKRSEFIYHQKQTETIQYPIPLERRNVIERLKKIQDSGRIYLNEYESKEVLNTYNIAVTKEKIVETYEDALEFIEKTGWPVAIKVSSPDIVHKTEAKIIELNVNDPLHLKKAFLKILHNAQSYNSKAKIDGVLVQEMLPPGVEVIVGMSNDFQFGPTIMFGLGGIFVEVLKDVVLKVCPICQADAKDMIYKIKGHGLLTGFRGQKEADVMAIEDILIKISLLSMDLQNIIDEIDINPIVVFDKGYGAKACDALIKLKKKCSDMKI